jgi:predicted nucleotide-binding protein
VAAKSSRSKKGTEESDGSMAGRSFPRHTLSDSLDVVRLIWVNNQGEPYDTIDLAKSLDTTVRSSSLIQLLGSSARYGLTTGSTRSPRIALTELGRSIAESIEGPSQADLRKALLAPPLYARLLPRLDRKVIPKGEVLEATVGREFGIHAVDAVICVKVLRQNIKELGISQDLKGTEYLQLDKLSPPTPSETPDGSTDAGGSPDQVGVEDKGAALLQAPKQSAAAPPGERSAVASVFIAHGSNKKLLGQVKQVVEFGLFVPIVADERQSTMIPVPEKVISDMHDCQAAIIIVSADDKIKDADGNESYKINENVLIEIGAATVLYRQKVILLWDRRIKIPSNLQGLYRCDFEGDSLDWETGMKLQKTLTEFRKLDPSSSKGVDGTR